MRFTHHCECSLFRRNDVEGYRTNNSTTSLKKKPSPQPSPPPPPPPRRRRPRSPPPPRLPPPSPVAPPIPALPGDVAIVRGSITSISVANAGSGYTSPPTVSISAPTPIVGQVLGTVLVTGEWNVAINPTENGPYTAVPTVLTIFGGMCIHSDCTGPMATLVGTSLVGPQCSNTDLKGILTVAPSTGALAFSTVASSWRCTPSAPPTILLASDTLQAPKTATAVTTISNGIVTGITVIDGGSGYVSTPVVSIGTSVPPETPPGSIIPTPGLPPGAPTPPGSFPSPATSPPISTPPSPQSPPNNKIAAVAGAVTLVGGSVSSIAIQNPGFGYVTEPAVTISAPPGAGNINPAQISSTVSPTGALSLSVSPSNNGPYSAVPSLSVGGGPCVSAGCSGAIMTIIGLTTMATGPACIGMDMKPLFTVSSTGALVVAGVPTSWTCTPSMPPIIVPMTDTMLTPTPATAIAYLSGSSVGFISIINGGSGYVSAPTVKIGPP